jgi:hypothetical protein
VPGRVFKASGEASKFGRRQLRFHSLLQQRPLSRKRSGHQVKRLGAVDLTRSQFLDQSRQHIELAKPPETSGRFSKASSERFAVAWREMQERYELTQSTRGDASSMKGVRVAVLEPGQLVAKRSQSFAECSGARF